MSTIFNSFSPELQVATVAPGSDGEMPPAWLLAISTASAPASAAFFTLSLKAQ